MRAKIQLCLSAAALAALSACAVAPPSGPTIAAMPGPGKSFDQFNRDDYDCRNFAASRTNVQSVQQQQNNEVGTAVAGTALGAAAGALLGAAGGNAGAGAAVGAGVGLLGGSAVAANQNQGGAYWAQRTYNIAYAQCMTAKDNSVPGRMAGPPGSYGPPPGYGPPANYGPPPGYEQPNY